MNTPKPATVDLFLPLLRAAQGLDLSQPRKAAQELESRFPADSAEADALRDALKAHLAAGTICDRGEAPMKFGRVSKATPESLNFSIDIVDMDGPGPKHKHPQGEVNFCVALEGEPKFDGNGPGWVVFPPESVHIPTVSGGRMLIVYLLPAGAMEFMGA
ncbi:MAG: DUF4863 family protein [Planctomycetes bacterium]|nr:DUF4863 family protein [Planctomycetota bacterium]